jgi:hypothetical protein
MLKKYVHAPLVCSDFVLSKILQIEGNFLGEKKIIIVILSDFFNPFLK